MKAIVDGSNLNKEGKGICFSLPVQDVAGINHLLSEKEKKDVEKPKKTSTKKTSKKAEKEEKKD